MLILYKISMGQPAESKKFNNIALSDALSYDVSGPARKPVFGVSNQARHKLGCATTEEVDELFYLCS